MDKPYDSYRVIGHSISDICHSNRVGWRGLLHKNELKRWLMRINSTCILLLFVFIEPALAIRAEKIKLSYRDVFVETFFTDNSNQSGCDFICSKDLVANVKLGSIHARSRKLSGGLVLLFRDEPFIYAPENKTTIIKECEKIRTERVISNSPQPINVKGRVLGQNLEPLVGANVQVKGQKISSLTGQKGEFSLNNLPDNAVLLISYVGYASKEINLGDRSTDLGSIVLTMSMAELTEVVVNTGYQRLSSERVTGSFGVVTGKKLESRLATDLRSALEGQLTGVVLNKSGGLEIRGVSSFSAEKNPLVVVDGYPTEGGVDNINPLNISSITVLKDAVAASIYGSRAANGVIVVTTKTGIKGRPRFTYSGLANYVSKPRLKDLNRASSSDYIDAELDVFNQNPNAPSTTDKEDMSRVTYLMMQVREKKITEEDAMAEINSLRNVDALQQVEDYFYRPEISNQHNFNLSGADEKYNYNVAVNVLNTRGNVLGSNSNRLVLDVKNEWKPLNFLTAGATINLVYNNSLAPMNSLGPILEPYTNIVDANGNPTEVWGLSQYKIDTYKKNPGMKEWSYIPLNDIFKATQTNIDFQTRVNGFLRANIIKGLTAEFGGTWQRGSTFKKQLRDADAYAVRIAYNDATSITNIANHYLPDGGIVDETRNLNESWTIRSQLSYNRNFDDDKHRISLLTGNEVRKLTFDNNTLETRVGYNPTAGSYVPMNAKDYNADLYTPDMLMGRNIKLGTGSYGYRDNRFVSWYGNGSYEYDNRFILSGSIRLDLTNFFGTDPKYRYRPLWSVGGTYKLAEETFLKNKWVNRLNIRASYGVSGNISLSQGPFLILSAGEFNSTTGGISYGVSSPPNNQLRWERTGTINLGLDVAAWNNRLNATIDYYTKNSTDLLAPDNVDITTGYSSITRNVGSMSNSGVELSFNMDLIRHKVFRWNVGPNISYNYNNVKTYNVSRPYVGNYTVEGGLLAAGYPADGLWGFRFAGLNNLGETQVYNAANEVIKPGNATPADMVYLGTLRPKFDLSLNNTLNYKNWDLTVLFISKLGNKYRKDSFNSDNYQNRHVAERWQRPGDEEKTIYPVLKLSSTDRFNFAYIDALIGNASYVKLRDLTLSYNFKEFAKKLKMNNLKVFTQGRNLFRITAKGTDADPENLSLSLPREFFFGVTFSF